MSLTSYRAAPPRATHGLQSRGFEGEGEISQSAAFCWNGRACAVGDCKEAFVLGRPGNDLLSRVLRHSTIGAEEFNGRVRDGIGFLAPRSNHRTGEGQTARAPSGAGPSFPGKLRPKRVFLDQAVSRTRTMRAIKPIEPLVPVSSTRYRAYTPGLSTWSSSTALKGELVSRWVSRLDAFSGYPVRT